MTNSIPNTGDDASSYPNDDDHDHASDSRDESPCVNVPSEDACVPSWGDPLLRVVPPNRGSPREEDHLEEEGEDHRVQEAEAGEDVHLDPEAEVGEDVHLDPEEEAGEDVHLDQEEVVVHLDQEEEEVGEDVRQDQDQEEVVDVHPDQGEGVPMDKAEAAGDSARRNANRSPSFHGAENTNGTTECQVKIDKQKKATSFRGAFVFAHTR